MSAITFLKVLRKLKLNNFYKPIRSSVPQNIKTWIKANSVQTLVSVDELKPMFRKACVTLAKNRGVESIGDYLEFGVYHGASLNCMNQVLQELKYNHVRLFGFDSFEGLPEPSEIHDGGFWQAGQFYSNYNAVRKFLSKNGVDWQKTFLVKGWYSDTLTDGLACKHNIKKASLIMIDCDIYSSAKEALNFCAPLIKDQAIIFFDDWYTFKLAENNMGEKRAFDEFLEENPHLHTEEFDSYKYRGKVFSKNFLVSNSKSE